MDVEKLFNGIAVIVDNEIEKKTSEIYKIKELIETKGIPVAVFSEVPQLDVIPALASASFIILDWDYTNGELEVEEGERVAMPGALVANEEERLIEFIKKLLSDIFVPVFIFTAKQTETVIESLKETGLWDDEKENRIFVKQKTEVDTEEELFSAIADWVKKMPSVYVLKEWERVLRKTQNKMFNEFYSYSPNWTQIIWDMLKNDSIENQQEFGDFVTRSMQNRVQKYSFDEASIRSDTEPNVEELRKVVEGERYLSYVEQPAQAYAGDLFKEGRKYYLNIRAQCSLAREEDPELYCIQGEKLRSQDIISEDIRLTTEEELVFSAKKHFSLEKMHEICQDTTKLAEFNQNFSKHRNSIFFRKGTILERDDKIIIGCVAGEQAIQFNMNLKVVKFSDWKAKRVGRVLPPYITKIQQKCAVNMVREGVMPLPKELFISFDE